MTSQLPQAHGALARLAQSRSRLHLALYCLQMAEQPARGAPASSGVRDALGSLVTAGLMALLKRWRWIAVPTLTELLGRWLAAQVAEPDRSTRPSAADPAAEPAEQSSHTATE